jgi:hypothetical protein
VISDAVAVALTIAIPAMITSVATAVVTIKQANRAAEKVVVQTEAAATKLAIATEAKADGIASQVARNTALVEAVRAEVEVVHKDTNGNLSKVNKQLDTALETIARLEKLLSEPRGNP